MVSAACGFAAAVGEVGGGDLLEVVDVVDEAAFDLVHAGVDVAGDGDVDEEHGAVAAALEEVLAVGAAEDFCGAPVEVMTMSARGACVVEIVEGDDFGVTAGLDELGGDLFGAGLRCGWRRGWWWRRAG